MEESRIRQPNSHNFHRVAPIDPLRDEGRRLLCNNCNQLKPIETMWADFNGPAFRAFYCAPCFAEVAGIC